MNENKKYYTLITKRKQKDYKKQQYYRKYTFI